jgi:hypothetical protein
VVPIFDPASAERPRRAPQLRGRAMDLQHATEIVDHPCRAQPRMEGRAWSADAHPFFRASERRGGRRGGPASRRGEGDHRTMHSMVSAADRVQARAGRSAGSTARPISANACNSVTPYQIERLFCSGLVSRSLRGRTGRADLEAMISTEPFGLSQGRTPWKCRKTVAAVSIRDIYRLAAASQVPGDGSKLALHNSRSRCHPVPHRLHGTIVVSGSSQSRSSTVVRSTNCQCSSAAAAVLSPIRATFALSRRSARPSASVLLPGGSFSAAPTLSGR